MALTPEERRDALAAVRDSEVRFVTDSEGPPIYDVPAQIDPEHVEEAVRVGLAQLGEPERVGLSTVQEVHLTAQGEARLSDGGEWPEE